LPACFGQSVIAGNPAGKDACVPRQVAITFSEELDMTLRIALKQLKSGGAPASSRAGFTARLAREDAGAPFSEEIRMKLSRKYRDALFILAMSCAALTAQAQDKPGPVTINPPTRDNPGVTIVNPAIDMDGFLRISKEAAEHRKTRRLTEEEFI
jgi:hypothetical protein